jgi:hypothetical protein
VRDPLALPFGPNRQRKGKNRMATFTYRLELQDGTPADPPTLDTATPTCRIGDTIPLGRDRIFGTAQALIALLAPLGAYPGDTPAP